MLENKHILQYDLCFIIDIYVWNCLEGLRGDDRMVVGFSPITTKVVSSNPVLGEVYQIQMRNRSPLWFFLSRLLRPPSCFSGSLVLRSRDFSKYNPILTCPKIGAKMSIIVFKMFNESHFQKKKLKKNYYLFRLFIEKYMPRRSKLSFLLI